MFYTTDNMTHIRCSSILNILIRFHSYKINSHYKRRNLIYFTPADLQQLRNLLFYMAHVSGLRGGDFVKLTGAKLKP